VREARKLKAQSEENKPKAEAIQGRIVMALGMRKCQITDRYDASGVYTSPIPVQNPNPKDVLFQFSPMKVKDIVMLQRENGGFRNCLFSRSNP
jgi:hypothetical protein